MRIETHQPVRQTAPLGLAPLSPLPSVSPATLRPQDQLKISDNAGWEAFLAKARGISKNSLVPDPASLTRSETLPPHQAIALTQAVLILPHPLNPALQLAVADLQAYLQRVTGRPALMRTLPADGSAPDLRDLPAEVQLIALGQGAPHAWLPTAPTPAGSFALEARSVRVGERELPLVSLNASERQGQQYGVYRLLELSGKRFFHYLDDYAPDAGQGLFPANGYREDFAPAPNMQVRGFAPHLYHPTPLSAAFHEPSAEHLEMMKAYIDWLVQTRQNNVKFDLLELDQSNKLIPMRFSDEKFKAWLPYAREIVDYAHTRGVQVSVNAAFANYTSANVYAINPAKAMWQSFRLNNAWKDLGKARTRQTELEQELRQVNEQLAQLPGLQPGLRRRQQQLNAQLAQQQRKVQQADGEYQRQLSTANASNGQEIHQLIDRLMQVSWDEISWNLGTSEFTPTNDDLTLHWMNAAAAYLRERYPQVRTVVSSHTPPHPVSEKYQTPYFDLVKYADPGMGLMAHTVQAYSLTDRAPIYGAENFEHKLKLMYETGQDRFDVYYPETSYWLGVDADLPLFLPVYALNRAHDMAMIRELPHTEGQMTFTTGWEWGYWLNDYAVARMQANPDANLSEILDGAFAIFGSARTPMTQLMIDTMLSQQELLLDGQLLGYLKGSSWLTDLGHQIKEMPVLKELFDGTDTTPARLTPATLQKWNLAQLEAFEQGDLRKLYTLMESFRDQSERAQALADQIPAAAQDYYQELCDGWQINLLRVRQAYAAMNAAVYARKAELLHQPALRVRGEQYVAETRQLVIDALELIRQREQDYREPAETSYAKGQSLTLWKNHYLTDLHTGVYWQRTYNEVAKIYRAEPLNNPEVSAPPRVAAGRSLGQLSWAAAQPVAGLPRAN